MTRTPAVVAAAWALGSGGTACGISICLIPEAEGEGGHAGLEKPGPPNGGKLATD